jgi:HAE1 family hydrophobic/amphiphilic exporter-1
MFEAFLLLPSHYADWTINSQVYRRGERPFFKKLRIWYGHVLIKVLRRRYIVLGVMVLILFSSLGIIPMLGVEMFGDEDWDQFRILMKLPEGTSLEETDRIVKKYENALLQLPQSQVKSVVTNVGLMQGDEEWLTRKNVAQIIVELIPIEARDLATDEIINMARNFTSTISGPTFVEFAKISGGPPVGKPIAVKVQGKYL